MRVDQQRGAAATDARAESAMCPATVQSPLDVLLQGLARDSGAPGEWAEQLLIRGEVAASSCEEMLTCASQRTTNSMKRSPDLTGRRKRKPHV